MLEPQDRRQLLDCLRPPEGYSLDFALGTTFTLDLLALLTAPVAFTFFDWENEAGQPTSNPHALLAAIRRNADRIALFCQAGRIAIPSGYKQLFSYLEDSVFQVAPLNPEGVFHPKIWFLRYCAPDQPVRYRFLCLSRNLTFDRSWDTALVLEGDLQDRKRPYARNRPLCDFLAALPKFALRQPVPERIEEMIRLFRRELIKVDFELPDNFDDVQFWPLGIERAESEQWPFKSIRSDRILVVSPFLSIECLQRLENESQDNVIISRSDSLAELPVPQLKHFSKFFCLNPSAEAEPDEEADTSASQSPLRGLHAKLYLMDQGWDSVLLTGSANATNAAFSHNVEFLTGLLGKKSSVGIEALLSHEKGQLNLFDLLQEFNPGEPVKIDLEQKRLERVLQDAVRAIAHAPLEARVEASDSPGEFVLKLSLPEATKLEIPCAVQIRCRPVSLSEVNFIMVNAAESTVATFGHITLLAITSFFAFQAEAVSGEKSVKQGFVLKLPLINVPASRMDAVLQSLLQNREAVTNLFLMLLSGDSPPDRGDQSAFSGLSGEGTRGASNAAPLFESLLGALDRSPQRIDDIARLVEDLRQSPNSKELLPEGFDKIWPAIAAVRAKLPS